MPVTWSTNDNAWMHLKTNYFPPTKAHLFIYRFRLLVPYESLSKGRKSELRYGLFPKIWPSVTSFHRIQINIFFDILIWHEIVFYSEVSFQVIVGVEKLKTNLLLSVFAFSPLHSFSLRRMACQDEEEIMITSIKNQRFRNLTNPYITKVTSVLHKSMI